MTNQVKSLAELQDSRFFYKKHLPVFGYATILIIAGVLVGVFVWSLVTPYGEATYFEYFLELFGHNQGR
ncbi:MAG: hypothetical protein LBC29_02255 [Propionibacteriaceae bacterium]|nr:hypothetical protein [Propionibacteriaceae bacterium]